MQKNTIVFIALDTEDVYYKQYYKKIRDSGFKLVTVNLKWNYNNLSDWVEQAVSSINAIEGTYYVVGHSVGASVALMIQNKANQLPKKIILYSPSPVFREFQKYFNRTTLRFFGAKRMKQILFNSLKHFLKNCTVPIEVRYGGLEHDFIKITVQEIQKIRSDVTVTEYKNADHMSIIYDSKKIP